MSWLTGLLTGRPFRRTWSGAKAQARHKQRVKEMREAQKENHKQWVKNCEERTRDASTVQLFADAGYGRVSPDEIKEMYADGEISASERDAALLLTQVDSPEE